MANILSLIKTVTSGFILLILIILLMSTVSEFYFDYAYTAFIFRWLHALSE